MGDRVVAGARLNKLGRYEVLSELGKGAMGVVYLARDPVIGRMVAIKTIKASNMARPETSRMSVATEASLMLARSSTP